jgi:hypothetical protein
MSAPGDLFVPIMVAVMAGAITLVGSMVTRGNLVSGFRQSWINDQRADLATIAAKATLLSSNLSSDWAGDIEAFMAAFSRIRLRENPDKPEWKKVLDEIDDLYRLLWSKRGNPHDVTQHLATISVLAQRPLKANWNKTRTGETLYRVVNYGAIACLLVAVGMLTFNVIARADKAVPPPPPASCGEGSLPHSKLPPAADIPTEGKHEVGLSRTTSPVASLTSSLPKH